MNRLRVEVFRCCPVSFAGIVFQACSFNRSDISPFRINNLRAARHRLSHTPATWARFARSLFHSALCSLTRTCVRRNCVRPLCRPSAGRFDSYSAHQPSLAWRVRAASHCWFHRAREAFSRRQAGLTIRRAWIWRLASLRLSPGTPSSNRMSSESKGDLTELTNSGGEQKYATPAMANGRIAIRAEHDLVAIGDARDYQTMGRHRALTAYGSRRRLLFFASSWRTAASVARAAAVSTVRVAGFPFG